MEHDFSELYSHCPAIIEQMPETFTTHQFILKLAQQNQRLYMDALYSQRDKLHRGQAAPFMMVHRFLAQHLSTLPNIVAEGQVASKDIFGRSNNCEQWRKR